MNIIIFSRMTGTIYANQKTYDDVEIDWPKGVTALYWMSVTGWTESESGRLAIDRLPAWAESALKRIPDPEQPESPEAHKEAMKALRATAYREEADPIFFKWQRGESTKDAWESKVKEIRRRYPEGEE